MGRGGFAVPRYLAVGAPFEIEPLLVTLAPLTIQTLAYESCTGINLPSGVTTTRLPLPGAGVGAGAARFVLAGGAR